MPIIKSAKKRVRVAHKASIRNSKTKRNLKSALKTLAAKPSSATHASAQSNIDKAAKKGLIHKNKVARMKKRAAALAKSNKVKLSAKTTSKKPVTKAPAKKPGKKPAPKRAVSKKPKS